MHTRYTSVAGASMDGSVRVWLADTGENVTTLYGPAQGIVWYVCVYLWYVYVYMSFFVVIRIYVYACSHNNMYMYVCV